MKKENNGSRPLREELNSSAVSEQNQCHLVKLIGSLRGKPLTKIYKL